MPPPPLPIQPSLASVKNMAEAIYKAIPASAKKTFYQALEAALTGKPTVAARLLKLTAETQAIRAAGRGGKLPR